MEKIEITYIEANQYMRTLLFEDLQIPEVYFTDFIIEYFINVDDKMNASIVYISFRDAYIAPIFMPLSIDEDFINFIYEFRISLEEGNYKGKIKQHLLEYDDCRDKTPEWLI